jgi:exonuclease III
VVVGDFNNPLITNQWSSKQKINNKILELNYTINQMDLADIYRIFHPTSAQYTFFSAANQHSKNGYTTKSNQHV